MRRILPTAGVTGLLCLSFTLAALPAAPARAQLVVERAQSGHDVRLLEVKAEVTDLGTGKTQLYPTTQQVPLTVGQQVALRLVGRAVIGGQGRQIALPANFDVTAGDWRIDTAPRGDGALTVTAVSPNEDDRGKAGTRAQLFFRLRGEYDAKPQLTTGRVTFDISPAEVTGEVASPDSERWQQAARIAHDLAAVRLDGGTEADVDWVERIYLAGTPAIQEVAAALAQQAVREQRLRDQPPWEVTALLYQRLLGRSADAEQLWREDSGFRGNIKLLQDRGYPALVDTLVRSAEFHDNHALDQYGRLALPAAERQVIERRRAARVTRP